MPWRHLTLQDYSVYKGVDYELELKVGNVNDEVEHELTKAAIEASKVRVGASSKGKVRVTVRAPQTQRESIMVTFCSSSPVWVGSTIRGASLVQETTYGGYYVLLCWTCAIRLIEGCLSMRGIQYKRTPTGRRCVASDTLLMCCGDGDSELR